MLVSLWMESNVINLLVINNNLIDNIYLIKKILISNIILGNTQSYNPVLQKALNLGTSLNDKTFLFAVYDEFLRADSIPQLFNVIIIINDSLLINVYTIDLLNFFFYF